MNRTEFEMLVEQSYATTPEHPFAKDNNTIVYRHTNNKKWYAVVMTVAKQKLGIKCEGNIDIVNLKCDNEIIYSMWQEKGIYPAYHMNKNHWLSVALDNSADDRTISWLLDMSYSLTA